MKEKVASLKGFEAREKMKTNLHTIGIGHTMHSMSKSSGETK